MTSRPGSEGVAAQPARVASLSLVEPAWSFLPLTTIEQDYFTQFDAALRLPATEARSGFRRRVVRGDIELPALRADIAEQGHEREATGQSSALRAMTDAMQRHPVDPAAFGRLVVGSSS